MGFLFCSPLYKKLMQERLKYLFRKFLDNNCTKEEFDEVFSLIKRSASDPALRMLLERILDEENILAIVDEDATFVNSGGRLEPYPAEEVVAPVRRIAVRKKLLWSIAASVILIAGIFSWLFITRNSRREAYARYVRPEPALLKKQTNRSEYKYLLLSDSTQVWLNAASTLEFPEVFDSKKREVVLKGEAFFDVKHADKIPFIIYTEDVSSEVMGTAFNIKAYPDLEKITVSVKRGLVRVKYADRRVALLGIGEQISIEKTDHLVKEKKFKEEETYAWQQGKLIYDDYTLGDITRDLERIYNVNINVQKDSVENLRITTSFDKASGVDKALEVLSRLTDAKLEKRNNIYYIK